jgi:3D (Asp-Asp-Asp) domain-containing protein
MHNLIQYCIDKGVDKFIRFKFERKCKYVMIEHFVSNADVIKYNLHLYVNKDKYGRYKLSKYVSRNLVIICEWIYHNINGNMMDIFIENKMRIIDDNIKKSELKQRIINNRIRVDKLKKLG